MTRAKVIVFPMAGRVGKIRRTAAILSEKSGKAAVRYWEQVAGGLVHQMQAASVPVDDIEREMVVFRDAVRAEVVRLSCVQRAGGAA